MWSYIILAIILILIFSFLVWAWEEPAVGITAVVFGIIAYWSGSHTAGIIIGIIGVACYIHAKEYEKECKDASEDIFLQNTLFDTIERYCNSDTCEFNWKIWFDTKDQIFYKSSNQQVKKSAQSEFEHIGRRQVALINLYLTYMKDENNKNWAMNEIKKREHMIRELLDTMWQKEFYSKNTKLYNEVLQYRTDVYDYIIYENKQLTPTKLSSMIKQGEAIYIVN